MQLHLPYKQIDGWLLLLLICFANSNPAIKALGIGFLFLAPNTWRLRFGQLGIFYLIMLVLGASGIFYFFLHLDVRYLFMLGIGSFFWLLCLLLHSTIYRSVMEHPPVRTNRTLLLFFYIMAVCSLAQWGEWLLRYPSGFAYGMPVGNTGDNMRAFYTFSSDAMLVYGMFLFWFIQKRWWGHMLAAAVFLLWTNFMAGVLIFIVALGIYVIYLRPMHWMLRLPFLTLLAVGFGMVLYIAWYNFSHMYYFIDQTLSGEQVFRKITAHGQTLSYVGSDPKAFFFGAGMGNFSSRLAFMAGGDYVAWYPKFLVLRSPLFEENHFSLWNSSWPEFLEGIANQPFSIYNQFLGEYGLLGFFVLMFFYVGFFMRHWHRYAPEYRAVIFMLLGMFFLDYWFEYFSILLFFEWFMLYGLRKQTETPSIHTRTASAGHMFFKKPRLSWGLHLKFRYLSISR